MASPKLDPWCPAAHFYQQYHEVTLGYGHKPTSFRNWTSWSRQYGRPFGCYDEGCQMEFVDLLKQVKRILRTPEQVYDPMHRETCDYLCVCAESVLKRSNSTAGERLYLSSRLSKLLGPLMGDFTTLAEAWGLSLSEDDMAEAQRRRHELLDRWIAELERKQDGQENTA